MPIAEVAMWLMDHQLNPRLSEAFGNLYLRLPLTRTARIVHGNALLVDWAEALKLRGLQYSDSRNTYGLDAANMWPP